jgi:hypothetical protein
MKNNSIPTPPNGYFFVANMIFTIRRFVLKYLSLPRPNFMRVTQLSSAADPSTGRYHWMTYLSHPYYNKPSFLNRWGLEAWLVRIGGGEVPGSNDKYIPEGYKFEEIGPNNFKNKGLDETNAWEEKLQRDRPGGCPFPFTR